MKTQFVLALDPVRFDRIGAPLKDANQREVEIRAMRWLAHMTGLIGSCSVKVVRVESSEQSYAARLVDGKEEKSDEILLALDAWLESQAAVRNAAEAAKMAREALNPKPAPTPVDPPAPND